MNNEEEILKIKNITNRKIKELKYIINKLELESYNLELKNNQTNSKYNIVKSRNVDLTKQVFELKKRDTRFRKTLQEYENFLTTIKQHFQLESIEEITNYIQKNNIEKEQIHQEKKLEIENYTDIEKEFELPKNLKVNRPK
ncbi:hypothetical protein DS891_18005 [Pseudoalteromonas sp. JC28]|uniref:hypothetical protein n=1 Tax=Pseudoalteromonas sp. JC28 TaxID=2267617 RepID=UPI00157388F7|nr:hypothetical protein [Pseudoalteromonas sp. JC28]NSY35436.1 hypothetical protein [Pseudoalteromonas sp. JC28]